MVAGENNAGLGGQHSRPALQKHSWSNQPSTPTQTFRTWMKDFKCDEIAPWRWRQGSLQLSLPASAETTSQAHKIRQWQWRRSPLQMRGELEQNDLEAAGRALEFTSANGRTIMFGSVCSPAMLHKMKPEESPKCPWCNCRPAKPDTFLSWRFAWPTWDMTKVQHLRLLTWLALLDRYEQTMAANAAVLDAVYPTKFFGAQGWTHYVQPLLGAHFWFFV